MREENLKLKQDQKELKKLLSSLKQENESLLHNADMEVKRMSDFIDQYKVEVEVTKKQWKQEYEEKLNSERKKNDEVKRKFHK